MKKYITILVLAFVTLKATAQDTITNPSFERWTTGSGYMDPTGWTTPNSLTIEGGGSAEVTQSTNAYSGTYAAQLTTDTLALAGRSIPGFVLLGSINIIQESITGGVPFYGRPDTLYGYYQYTPASGKIDSCLVYAILTRWNPSKLPKAGEDTVVEGVFKSGSTVTSYTKFAVPFEYSYFPHGGEVPDTIQLAVASSSKFLTSPPVGSTMLVDDLSFSADTTVATGINAVHNNGFSISCYPNPAKSNLNILISQPQPGMTIKVYDVLGRNLLVANSEGLITSVDVSTLLSGAYFYEVADKNGNLLQTEKFTVVR